jgi:methionyl-tRNA synthetase
LGPGELFEFNEYLLETMKSIYAYNPDYNKLNIRVGDVNLQEYNTKFISNIISNNSKLNNVLYHLFEAIRIGASLLEPIMPSTAKSIYNQINTTLCSFEHLTYGLQEQYVLNDAVVLFKRLDVNKDVLEIVLAKEAAKEQPKVETKVEEKAEPAKPEITIDDFDKLDLVVGEIVEAKKHPKADKLLVFKVNIGFEVRQIVSGIAKFYNPDDLVGKKVVVVKNLKPITLRGETSHGMLMCAFDKNDKDLELLNVTKLNAGDLIG